MELSFDLNKKYSFSDYLSWAGDARHELINGIVKLMSPAPNSRHQAISGNMTFILRSKLKKSSCKVFYAPFDVRLPLPGEEANDKIFTVVQPDICVICDPKKIDERGCLGAPDLIVEIVSPNNAHHDIKVKFELYQEHGVREYWIVYPLDKIVSIYFLGENGRYQQHGLYALGDTACSAIFPDLEISMDEVFEE